MPPLPSSFSTCSHPIKGGPNPAWIFGRQAEEQTGYLSSKPLPAHSDLWQFACPWVQVSTVLLHQRGACFFPEWALEMQGISGLTSLITLGQGHMAGKLTAETKL